MLLVHAHREQARNMVLVVAQLLQKEIGRDENAFSCVVRIPRDGATADLAGTLGRGAIAG